MLKAIIFDFDGVICESSEIKTEAFRRLFSQYPRHRKEIIAYHERNGGISRFVKFKVIYRDILKKKLTAEQTRYLGKKFAQYSLQAVLKAGYVKGAIPFFKKYHKELFLFIVSGTPQAEMRLIAKNRQLTKFFKGVFGSPRTKKELIAQILRQNKLKKEEVIFVGDSINDYEGAKEIGVAFIGRLHKNMANPFVGEKNIKGFISDFSDLNAILQQEFSLHYK